ncbi:MAG TPA: bifunctional metallophosphatase/5'-nucleotidase [Candidatus Faecousia intestinigallinarum]|nr:bifunctional metallophosphatase/5'-nucleotidase [Candidatus Faecousia intestinigallinarum]
MMTKKIIALIMAMVLCLGLAACASGETPTVTTTAPTADTQPTVLATEPAAQGEELVILYTNDVHNAYQRGTEDNADRMGYAALAAYAKALEAEGSTVVLVDGGDAIQGEAVGTLSKGAYLVDIMNEVGYDIAVPGNHEFDFGMDTFLDLANNKANYQYVSCNFTDLRTGETVFQPYVVKEFDGVKVAFVGISTPETFTKSTPTYFQDEEGNYIYGFAEGNEGQDLYECVQNAIDQAKLEADYVICVGHVGTDPASSPWTSTEIIANTTGMTAFLDGHSHSVINGETVTDKDGNTVVVCSTGTKLTAIGELRLNLADGTATASLVTGLTEDDPDVLAYTNDIAAQFEELLASVVATSELELVVNDPETDERIVRSQETNLGDLCADAYRSLLGADIGLVNGGGVRDVIHAGDVTYGDIIAVHPFGNVACLVEVNGQQILDALEMAYRLVGEGECGGFLQVSGLTCEVDTSIPSSVVLDDKENFVEVSGDRRVFNVMVNGEPIDPEAAYTVASHNYMLKDGGDGFTMFIGSPVLQDEVMIDNQVLITYIQETLGGVVSAEQYGDPYGEGRIVIH